MPWECHKPEQSEIIPRERQTRRKAERQQGQKEIQYRKQSEALNDLQTRQGLLVQLSMDAHERGRHERELPYCEICQMATSGEVALKLGRHFIGIELYENNVKIAEDRCHQAHLLRSEYEARNPMKASTPSFDEALNDPMPDEVQSGFDFDAGGPWEEAS